MTQMENNTEESIISSSSSFVGGVGGPWFHNRSLTHNITL